MAPRLLCVGRETSPQEFQGLLRAVEMVAKHPNFPGKDDVVKECIWDIVGRSREGRLTPVQRAELLKILLA